MLFCDQAYFRYRLISADCHEWQATVGDADGVVACSNLNELQNQSLFRKDIVRLLSITMFGAPLLGGESPDTKYTLSFAPQQARHEHHQHQNAVVWWVPSAPRSFCSVFSSEEILNFPAAGCRADASNRLNISRHINRIMSPQTYFKNSLTQDS